jgi:hypothetical protein
MEGLELICKSLPSGLRMPDGKLHIHGWYHGQIVRDGKVIDEFEAPNLVVNQGLDMVLDVVFRGQSGPGAWYLGLYQGTYTPVATVTAATIAAASNELIDYSEPTRPAWVPGPVDNRVVSNSASRATFTFTAARTVRGAFLINNATKNGTAGILASASSFGTPRSVQSSDQLLLTYNVSAAS